MRKQIYLISIIILIVSLIGILSLKSSITGFAIQETTLNETTTSALDSLLEAEKDILDLKVLNLTTFQTEDKLLEAKKHFLGKDFPELKDEFNTIQDPTRYEYSQLLLEKFSSIPPEERLDRNIPQTIEITNEIKNLKETTIELLDKIDLLETKEKELRKKFNTEKTIELLEQTKKSFYEERFNETNNILLEAESQLDQETAEYRQIFSLSQNFLKKYWIHTIIILIILVASIFIINKRMRIIKAKAKLKKCKIEIETINSLMKKTQLRYFKEKNLSKKSYEIRIERYKKRLNQIKVEIPVLENLTKKNDTNRINKKV